MGWAPVMESPLATALRGVVGGADQNAYAGGVDVRHLGEVELNALGRLLERQVDGVAQLVGVGDVDLARHGHNVALGAGVGGDREFHG